MNGLTSDDHMSVFNLKLNVKASVSHHALNNKPPHADTQVQCVSEAFSSADLYDSIDVVFVQERVVRLCSSEVCSR